MPRQSNQQLTLKPQDLVVLIKLSLRPEAAFAYGSFAKELFLSASEVHASLVRTRSARLAGQAEGEGHQVARHALLDFLLHGAQYAFPAVRGSVVRGMPTAYSVPPLSNLISSDKDPIPVWPYARGEKRGIALQPLYPTVPRAAEKDPLLYTALALFDAVRIGAARERGLASEALMKLLA